MGAVKRIQPAAEIVQELVEQAGTVRGCMKSGPSREWLPLAPIDVAVVHC